MKRRRSGSYQGGSLTRLEPEGGRKTGRSIRLASADDLGLAGLPGSSY